MTSYPRTDEGRPWEEILPVRQWLYQTPEQISRISPPVPVEAPLNGSTVVGKLCVSAFSEITLCMGGGKGSWPIAGTAVYMTSYPRTDEGRPWEEIL